MHAETDKSVMEIKTSFPFFERSERPDSIIRREESVLTRLAWERFFEGEKHYERSDRWC
jgi:hypothetical protein